MINQEDQYKKVVDVLKRAKDLSHLFNHYLKDKADLEEEFAAAYIDKEVVLICDSYEITGILKDINRFRIEIQTEDGLKFYNKSQLIGFYAKA